VARAWLCAMPNAPIIVPGLTGITSDRGANLSGASLAQATNVWFDPEVGNWTPRPTLVHYEYDYQNSLGFPSDQVVMGEGRAVFTTSDAGAPVNSDNWAVLNMEQMVTSPGTTNMQFYRGSAQVGRFMSKPVILQDKLVLFYYQAGTSEYGISDIPLNIISGSFYGFSGRPNITATGNPVAAFGRVWYLCRGNSAINYYAPQLSWTDALGTTLTGAGSGTILGTGSASYTSVTELSRRLVVTSRDKTYLFGSSSGGPPSDPNAAGGITVNDTIAGVGTDVGDWAVKSENALYILGPSGLHRLSTDSFSNQPETLQLGGEALQQLARAFYAETEPGTRVGFGAMRPGLINRAGGIYWPHGQLLIFSAPASGKSLVINLAANGGARASIWTGQTPSTWTVVGKELFGGFQGGTIDNYFSSPGTLSPNAGMTSYRRPNRTDFYGNPALYFGTRTTEKPFRVQFMVSALSGRAGVTQLFPKNVGMSCRYYVNTGVLLDPAPDRTWSIRQQQGEGEAVQVSPTYSTLVDGRATPIASPVGNPPYTTSAKWRGNLKGSGNSISVGIDISDGRWTEFVIDGIHVGFTEGRQWANR
jgi:hypothetical protein